MCEYMVHLRNTRLKKASSAPSGPTDPCRSRTRHAVSWHKCRPHSGDMCECGQPFAAVCNVRDRPWQGCVVLTKSIRMTVSRRCTMRVPSNLTSTEEADGHAALG